MTNCSLRYSPDHSRMTKESENYQELETTLFFIHPTKQFHY